MRGAVSITRDVCMGQSQSLRNETEMTSIIMYGGRQSPSLGMESETISVTGNGGRDNIYNLGWRQRGNLSY
jgi:hypothetical protein